ncbi:MAG TPA: 3-deoxy-7-phosphoheptulonate synthase [Candidatus Dojkabacteria bacterium]|jgi:3-deoxy-7-phosphoheptulonate synthase
MITRDELLSNKPLIVAGPCAVESREQILEVGMRIKDAGANLIRTQLWKPRTRPGTFQGIGEEGKEWILEVKEKTGLPVTMEIVSQSQVEYSKDFVDVLWVGSRNMQNFELLKTMGEDDRPVILKRGFINNIKEWLGAAEYCGFEKTILCERGIRTGADAMRFTLDLNGALVAKFDHDLPVVVDPSHPAGRRDMVPNLAYAGIAAGLDGVVIEVHQDPENAMSDADQQITPDKFDEVVKIIKKIHKAIN